MKIIREIGDKGQVVIPKDLRQLLGIRPRENIVFEVEDNRVCLKKEENPRDFVKDFLDVPGKEKQGSIKKIKGVIDEQYEEELY